MKALETAGAVLVFILLIALSPIIIPLMVIGFLTMAKMNKDIW
jgi:hypothetical protein